MATTVKKAAEKSVEIVEPISARDVAAMTEAELKCELAIIEEAIAEAGDSLTLAVTRRFEAIDKALHEMGNARIRFNQRKN